MIDSAPWLTSSSGPKATIGEAAEPAGEEQPASEQSEEELRAQLEEEIRKVRVEDVILQSAVSILNLSARRIAKDDERDLEQAKVGIDAARALTELVPEDAQAAAAPGGLGAAAAVREARGEARGREPHAAGATPLGTRQLTGTPSSAAPRLSPNPTGAERT